MIPITRITAPILAFIYACSAVACLAGGVPGLLVAGVLGFLSYKMYMRGVALQHEHEQLVRWEMEAKEAKSRREMSK